jgi:hypothetical protein
MALLEEKYIILHLIINIKRGVVMTTLKEVYDKLIKEGKMTDADYSFLVNRGLGPLPLYSPGYAVIFVFYNRDFKKMNTDEYWSIMRNISNDSIPELRGKNGIQFAISDILAREVYMRIYPHPELNEVASSEEKVESPRPRR